MKTSKIIYSALLVLALAGLTLTSCKKDKVEEDNIDFASIANLSEDEIAVEEATDESMIDVEGLLSYDGSSNLKSTYMVPCHATVDSTGVVNDTITIYITYNGLTCNGRLLRTGKVEIRKKVGTRFGQQGASVNVRHINYTVTRVGSGRSMTFNSSKTFTNVTGGFIFMLGHDGFNSLVHRVQGRMAITFDHGVTRSWLIARQKTFSGNRQQLVLAIDGFGTSGNYNNLVTWGTNRNSEEFFTQITRTVVLKQACEGPVSGIMIHQIPGTGKNATVTFGYDESNQPVTVEECPTHYKVDWQIGSTTGTRFVQLR